MLLDHDTQPTRWKAERIRGTVTAQCSTLSLTLAAIV
jgi:hypothetical protein